MAGGIEVKIEPAQEDLGFFPLAAKVDGEGDVVGVVKDLYGLAGEAVGSLVEATVDMDDAVAADAADHLHPHQGLQGLWRWTDEGFVGQEAVQVSPIT